MNVSFYHVQMNTYTSKIKALCIFKVAFCQTILEGGYIWFLSPMVLSNILSEYIIDSILISNMFKIYIISFYWVCLPEVGLLR